MHIYTRTESYPTLSGCWNLYFLWTHFDQFLRCNPLTNSSGVIHEKNQTKLLIWENNSWQKLFINLAIRRAYFHSIRYIKHRSDSKLHQDKGVTTNIVQMLKFLCKTTAVANKISHNLILGSWVKRFFSSQITPGEGWRMDRSKCVNSFKCDVQMTSHKNTFTYYNIVAWLCWPMLGKKEITVYWK